MGSIKQYRPAFFTGFENVIKTFSTLEELYAIEFVANFKDPRSGTFYRYSLSREQGSSEYPHVLMAEYQEGYVWYVIGYIDESEIAKQIPAWQGKRKE